MWNEIIDLVRRNEGTMFDVIAKARHRAGDEISRELAKVCATDRIFDTVSADVDLVISNMAETIYVALKSGVK